MPKTITLTCECGATHTYRMSTIARVLDLSDTYTLRRLLADREYVCDDCRADLLTL